MMLRDKNAVVYGAAGHIGSAVARAFAKDGARVFLAGRTLSKVEEVAKEINAEGGHAEVAEVDALDKESVEQHLDEVARKARRVDITFNAVWIRGDLQGTKLIDMEVDDFTTPVMVGVTTHFLTATAAARHMVRQHAGVILTMSSTAAGLSGRDRTYHKTGGFSTACTAIEALTRTLAGEVGPEGVRVVCLRSDALPETWPSVEGQVAEIKAYMDKGTAIGRLPLLQEVANAAVFAASDRASAMTGTIVNLSCGSVMDSN